MNLNTTLCATETIVRRFCVMQSQHQYVAIVLYSAYTHAADAFDFAPRLVVTSAEKRSGKSRTLEIITKLSANPMVAANATTAALFRSLETPKTVILDEADTIFGTKIKAEQNEDLRGLINAGFQRGTPVWRTVGPNHEPTMFSVFSPVVMAAIGKLPDTITDRAVNLRLRRRKATEKVEQYRSRINDPELVKAHDALAKAIIPKADELGSLIPENPLVDRAADLWEPLLAIAEVAGGKWPERAQAAALYLTESAGEDDEQSETLELLEDCESIWRWQKSDFMKSADLASKLMAMQDSRWSDGLTGRRLAILLMPYGIRPASNGSARGYHRAHFDDAFSRYLAVPVYEPSEPSTSAPLQASRPDASGSADTSEVSAPRKASGRLPRNTGPTDGSDGSGTTTEREEQEVVLPLFEEDPAA